MMSDTAPQEILDARDVLTVSQRAMEAYLRAPPIIVRRGKPAKPSRAA
jgi:hypothetical protein